MDKIIDTTVVKSMHCIIFNYNQFEYQTFLFVRELKIVFGVIFTIKLLYEYCYFRHFYSFLKNSQGIKKQQIRRTLCTITGCGTIIAINNAIIKSITNVYHCDIFDLSLPYCVFKILVIVLHYVEFYQDCLHGVKCSINSIISSIILCQLLSQNH